MAKVIVKVTGGSAVPHDASSVSELKSKLNLQGYTASVDGEPANDGDELEDGNYVTFSQAIKGGV